MQLFDVLMLSVALSMDAAAVGMTDGMSDPKMPVKRVLLTGGFFGAFQALMPLIGYFLTGLAAGAFLDVFRKASAWISFLLLGFLGGKMIFDGVKEIREHANSAGNGAENVLSEAGKLSVGKLFLQAIATSIDALAIGVTMQMAAISPEGLFPPVGISALVIGAVTFLIGVASVYIGKLIGNKLADKAELIGGIVLAAIGVKLLLEGLL